MNRKLTQNISLLCLCITLAVYSTSCQKFNPKPLDTTAVNAALKPVPISVLRVQAGNLHHPLMKPLEINEQDGLSPDEAAILAVLANPSLKAVRDQRGIARAQLLSAGILPNPQLSASIDVPVGNTTETFKGYSLGLNWDFTSLIVRQSKINAAKAELAAVDLDIAWQEWQIAQAAKIAAYRQISLEQELVVARQISDRLVNNLETIKKAVEQQLKTDIDLSAAQVASDEAHTTVLDITRGLHKQRLTIARLLGLPADSNIPIQNNIVLPSSIVPPPQADLLSNLEQRRLDLLALKRGYDSQEAIVRAAVLASFPKIDLGVNYARDTNDVYTVGKDIAVDMPIFDRNQGAISAEKATRQKLFDEYVNRVFESRSDISTLLLDIESLNKQIVSAQASLLPLEQLASEYKAAYDNGSADVISFYATQNDAAKKMIEILKLKQELMETRIGLEIAAGQYIPQSVQLSLNNTPVQAGSGELHK
jgi:outer membrane protein, heavy metal efflux system